jgi:hypothetical protein
MPRPAGAVAFLTVAVKAGLIGSIGSAITSTDVVGWKRRRLDAAQKP